MPHAKRHPLRTLRVLAGLTQYELACRVQRGQSWISAVERWALTPTDADLVAIAEALGAPEAFLTSDDKARSAGPRVLSGREVAKLPGLAAIQARVPNTKRLVVGYWPDMTLSVVVIPKGSKLSKTWWRDADQDCGYVRVG